MAERSVVFRFLSDTKGLKKGFGEANKAVQDSETVFAKVSGRLGGFSQEAIGQAVGITAVSTAVIAFATGAVKALGEEQVAAAQTGAAILSTGGAAAVTAEQVTTLADRLSKLSGVDDEVIQGGENLLLTFMNIKNGVGAGNDVFDQATKAALDMSVALGEDMSSSSIRLGKALQDPIAGVTALKRVGVMLTDQQKASIAAFMANGDIMSAQKVILAELNKEFGGSAEAFGKTIPGAIGKARTAFENWSGDLAKKALPAAQAFGKAATDVAQTVGPILGDAFGAAGKVITTLGGFLNDHKGYVVAAAVAYTAFLIPAVYRAVVAFGALKLQAMIGLIETMALKVMYLAGSMGTLNLALTAGGAIVGVVALGAFIQSLESAKAAAKAAYDEIAKPFDMSTIAGVSQTLAGTYAELAKNQALLGQYHNPVKAAFAGLYQTLTPAKNSIADYSGNVKEGEARSAELEATLARMRATIGTVSHEFGVGTDEIERFAKAQGIDLTGAVAETTVKLQEQYRATVEATKGWTGYGVSLEDAIALQKEITEAFQAAADPVKVYAAALTAAQTATKDSNKAAGDAIRDRAKAERDAVDTRHKAEKNALDGEFITGKASKAAHDQRVKDLDTRHDAEDAAADATVAAEGRRADAITNTAVQTTLSMEAYRRAVEQNTRDVTAWITNINLIASRPGGGEVAGMLAQLGPAQAGLVAQVLKSSPAAFATFVATMHAAGKTAVDQAALELNKLPGQVQTIAQTTGQTFAATLLEQVALGLKPLSAIVVKAAEDAIIAAGLGAADAMGVADAAGAAIGAAYKPPPAAKAPTGWGAIVTRAEGHFAQVAPAGAWRVWAEPETGGEAYIPLAASKRAGSMALVSQVANWFGGQVVPMAVGGTWGVPLSRASGGGSGAGPAVAALERAVAALQKASAGRRPAQIHQTFNEKIDPLHVARKISWELDH